MPMPILPNVRFALPPLTALALAACQTLTAPPDPQVAQIARSLMVHSDRFFTALAAKPAPDCDYDHNAPAYLELAGLAGQLGEHVSTRPASAPLRRAADALARTIDAARVSHEMASASAVDPAGTCMAGEAIALNADAVARASLAIAASQPTGGY